MAIVHILGLGQSLGAVVTPMSFVSRQLGRLHSGEPHLAERAAAFLGAEDEWHIARDADYSGKTNRFAGVVILTTQEVYAGTVKAYGYVDNIYGSTEGVQHEHLKESVFPTIVDQVAREIRGQTKADCGIYFAPVSLNDLQANIITVLRVLRWCAPKGQVGNNTWLSLTGGTNVINSSMLIGALLLGTAGRLYYNYVPQESLRYLRPTSEDPAWEDRFWCDLPPLRIDQNEGIYLLLDELRKHKDGLKDVELLEILARRDAGRGLFRSASDPQRQREDLTFFRAYYLNKLTPPYIRRVGEHQNMITQEGIRLYQFLNNPEIRGLLLPGPHQELTASQAGLTQVWP